MQRLVAKGRSMRARITASEWSGWCAVCESDVTFREYGPWHRDELVCTTCGSIPRQRAIMTVLSLVRPDWRRERIWELAPAGPASAKLQKECHEYLASQYWPDVPPGALVDGVRCEDLERPTLADNSMDVIVSSDVFEHIIDVEAAHAQIARVLDGGGIHVWTTPQYREMDASRPRVRRSSSGLEYLEPAQYHGDPVCASGALVTYDWGRDLPDRVMAASGMWTAVFRIESRTHGLSGEFLEVFVSHGGVPVGLAPEAHSALQTNIDDVQRARGELMARENELAVLRASRSWRLTAPLRSVAGTVRRQLDRPHR